LLRGPKDLSLACCRASALALAVDDPTKAGTAKWQNVLLQGQLIPRLPLFRLRQYDGRMSFSETIFLFFLALIIFGPKKLPEIARQVGKYLNEFKRASNEFKAQIEQEIAHLEVENKQTILPPAQPPEHATSRDRYAATELDAPTEAPALTAPASEDASTPGNGASGQAPAASDQPSPAAADPSEAVIASDPVGAAAAPEAHSSESHFPQSPTSESHA
jgi:sec-independent protein translocase protein TatB